MFAAGNIERNLKGAIDSVIWRRGERYHARGAVGACSYDSDDQECVTVLADVHGSQTYSTEITIDARSGEIHVALCDCPYAEENDVYCKHIAALGCALVERVRNIFGDQTVSAPVLAIAEALEAGGVQKSSRKHPSKKSPASPVRQHAAVRARLARMGFDMSLATDALVEEIARIMPADDTAPVETPALSLPQAQRQPFAERYAAIIKLGYNGARIHLHDTEQPNMPWIGAAMISRTALRSLLSDGTLRINNHERSLITYLSKHDTWSASFDAYHALALAKSAQIRLYQDSLDENRRVRFPPNTIPGLPMTMQRETWESHGPNGTPLERTRFEIGISAQVFQKSNISIGERGMVQVRKRDITLRPWSADAYAIMMRLKQSAGYARPERASTVLTEEETARINEIITELQRLFTLETDLAPDFVVTKYDDPQQALRIDYDAAAPKLKIRGAVDYGCTSLDVSDEWYPQGWYGHGATVHLSRRTDPKQHPFIVAIKGNAIGYAIADAKKEEAVYRTLYEKHGFNKRATLTLSGTKPIERFLHEHWDALSKLGWKMLFTRDEIKYETGDVKADINVDLDAERDWLAFDLALYCENGRVRLEDVIAFVEHGDECLKTEDGRLIRVGNRADLERLVRMLERFSQNETSGAFEGRLYNAPEVADVMSNSPHYRAQFAKSFDTFMKEAKSGTPVRRVKLPKSHRELLRPYQTTGVEWMHFLRRYRFGGILADEMGLGKTIQALSHVSVHTEDGETSLVVCPKTLLHNWKREAETRFPELSVAVVEGAALGRKRLILQKKNAPHLLITSYPLAQRDIEWYKARKKPFHYLLLDEAQSIKNPRTKNAH
ncbi:MAG TPA: SNF2-related protein, partial [Candidatus Paceibacterota bacterium]